MLEVCKDIEIDTKPTPLSAEELQSRTANNSNELINGSMGRECQKLYSRLAQVISEKKDLLQSISSNWIRTKFCFRLLKSSLLCLRGVENSMQKNCEIRNWRWSISHCRQKMKKLDDKHKTNIDMFDFFS